MFLYGLLVTSCPFSIGKAPVVFIPLDILLALSATICFNDLVKYVEEYNKINWMIKNHKHNHFFSYLFIYLFAKVDGASC